jgi:hypothetical protein
MHSQSFSSDASATAAAGGAIGTVEDVAFDGAIVRLNRDRLGALDQDDDGILAMSGAFGGPGR